MMEVATGISLPYPSIISIIQFSELKAIAIKNIRAFIYGDRKEKETERSCKQRLSVLVTSGEFQRSRFDEFTRSIVAQFLAQGEI